MSQPEHLLYDSMTTRVSEHLDALGAVLRLSRASMPRWAYQTSMPSRIRRSFVVSCELKQTATCWVRKTKTDSRQEWLPFMGGLKMMLRQEAEHCSLTCFVNEGSGRGLPNAGLGS